jgi:type VI secretion system protein ImpL
MLDLINSGSTMTAKQSSAMLSRSAAGATKMVCDQGMASRYPFVRNSKVDAAVMDFERLFGAQGLMATHFREHLASYVDTSNLPWRARPVQTGASQMISDDIVRSYEVADRIRAATLDSAGQLRVSSIIRFVDMDPQLMEVQLDVAGQSMRYAHGGSAPRRVDWQAQGGGLSVVMSLRDAEGRTEHMRFDGPWALFRFFDAGRTSGGSAEHRETVHHTRFGRVRMEWQAVTMPSPIWSNLFSSFQCPR